MKNSSHKIVLTQNKNKEQRTPRLKLYRDNRHPRTLLYKTDLADAWAIDLPKSNKQANKLYDVLIKRVVKGRKGIATKIFFSSVAEEYKEYISKFHHCSLFPIEKFFRCPILLEVDELAEPWIHQGCQKVQRCETCCYLNIFDGTLLLSTK